MFRVSRSRSGSSWLYQCNWRRQGCAPHGCSLLALIRASLSPGHPENQEHSEDKRENGAQQSPAQGEGKYSEPQLAVVRVLPDPNGHHPPLANFRACKEPSAKPEGRPHHHHDEPQHSHQEFLQDSPPSSRLSVSIDSSAVSDSSGTSHWRRIL